MSNAWEVSSCLHVKTIHTKYNEVHENLSYKYFSVYPYRIHIK